MAHRRHRPWEYDDELFPYRGPVGPPWRGNPAARNGRRYREFCRCDAWRWVNINGEEREYGYWNNPKEKE
jgi:hypothetical protein